MQRRHFNDVLHVAIPATPNGEAQCDIIVSWTSLCCTGLALGSLSTQGM